MYDDLTLHDDPRHSVWLRLARAHEHRITLYDTIWGYFSKEPCRVTVDSLDSAMFPALQIAEPLPMSFSLLAGDCLQNLRIALDHLAWSLALRSRQRPDSTTSFPICSTEDEWLGRVVDQKSGKRGRGGRRKIHHCGADAQRLIEELQPFRLAKQTPLHQQALEVFNKLARVDRHRTLTTTVPAHRQASTRYSIAPQTGNLITGGPFARQLATTPVHVPDSERTTVFSEGWTGGEHEYSQVIFSVTIDPSWEVAAGLDLLETLKACETDVWGVVQKFDGLFPDAKTVQDVVTLFQLNDFMPPPDYVPGA